MGVVEETDLPGVGVRYDFRTESGAQLGVLVHRNGARDLLLFSESDPDSCVATLRLAEDDARTLADLLGAPLVTRHLAAATAQIEGLVLNWVKILEESPLAGMSLRNAAVHTRTGVSVVGLIRQDHTVPAPGAEDVLNAGDTVIVVGTKEGLDRFDELLRTG